MVYFLLPHKKMHEHYIMHFYDKMLQYNKIPDICHSSATISAPKIASRNPTFEWQLRSLPQRRLTNLAQPDY